MWAILLTSLVITSARPSVSVIQFGQYNDKTICVILAKQLSSNFELGYDTVKRSAQCIQVKDKP